MAKNLKCSAYVSMRERKLSKTAQRLEEIGDDLILEGKEDTPAHRCIRYLAERFPDFKDKISEKDCILYEKD